MGESVFIGIATHFLKFFTFEGAVCSKMWKHLWFLWAKLASPQKAVSVRKWCKLFMEKNITYWVKWNSFFTSRTWESTVINFSRGKFLMFDIIGWGLGFVCFNVKPNNSLKTSSNVWGLLYRLLFPLCYSVILSPLNPKTWLAPEVLTLLSEGQGI